MSITEKPIGVALVVCERVIIEDQTKNKTLVSIFNNISVRGFPCRHDRLCAYVALTNGQGTNKVSLVLKLIEDGSKVFSADGQVAFQDVHQTVEVIFNIRDFMFYKPGAYAFEVYADDEYVFESRFTVNLAAAGHR
ncbi:MAG TPA: hypothetical protein VMF06_11350 [Candidatus Limnocylindria bacterium]|jgi:hypothetical protein|nr:hypothetical protein [Candidatus Limnocylindria bacterium]